MNHELKITLRCNECRAQFDESEAIDEEYCPECMSDSLFERVSYEEPELRETLLAIMALREVA